jgi:hypothetical protein
VGSGDYDDFYAKLKSEGYIINMFSGTITTSALSDVSVLIISCPGPSLSDAEIDAIRIFVSNGGGLFLQGVGWAWLSYEKRSLDEYPLNKLAMPYGFKWIGGYIVDQTNNRDGCPVFHTFFPSIDNNKIEPSEESITYSQKPQESESSTSSNLPPTAESLTPNPSSPQEAGAIVTWSAKASDLENDPLYYRFLLNGPMTDGKWKVAQEWSISSTWIWNTEEKDVGSSEISVLIKDGKHPSLSGFDDFKNSSGYKITTKQLKDINVQVATDIFSGNDQTVYYCQEGKYYYVMNRFYLMGPDLDKVKSVTYVLPQSFPNPEKNSDDTSNNFEVWILTWGKFNGKAIIVTKSGQEFEKDYQLTFKEKVEDAKRRGIRFVQKCEG